MTIPEHEHHVRVGLAHYEMTAAYGIRDAMQLVLRLPYDVKDMRVRYTTLDGAPFTPPYGDIHHRTETLTGISDPSVMLDVQRGEWIFGGGLSLPVGRIESDPIAAGRAGVTHEHMQFGTGTFAPLLSAQWRRAQWSAGAETRLTLYENREGFRAPNLVLWSAGRSFRIDRATLSTRLAGQYQSIGRWHGEIDEGSGFQTGGLRVDVALPVGALTITPNVYRELWTRSLAEEETFEQKWTYGLSVTVKSR
ncbi:MAG TPA: hypothetical protein VFN10_14100 [Thermoanaerobaculia bacterium]|nr:hypothetical protein [Thermoanaerobaculia bacterium]